MKVLISTLVLLLCMVTTLTPTVNAATSTYYYGPYYNGQWGSYGSGDNQFNYPMGLEVDSTGSVFVTDWGNHRISKFTSSGVFIKSWGTYGNGNGQFSNPRSLAIDSNNYIYVADTENHRIQKFDNQGNFIAVWGSNGSGDGQFSSPYAIAVGGSGNIYVAEYGNNRVQKFSSTGKYLTKWGSFGSGLGQFNSPYGIAADNNDNVYVGDTGNNRVQKFNSEGVFQNSFGSTGSAFGQFNQVKGIATDATGTLYVADPDNFRIQRISSSGLFLTEWGSSGTGNGQLYYPFDVALHDAGYIFTADTYNQQIQNIYVADTYNHRIQTFISETVIAVTDTFVVYNGNGNTSGAAPIDSNSYQSGSQVSVMGNTGYLAKYGYTFNGWNTLADGSGTFYAPGAVLTMGTADVTLYAQWSLSSSTLNYDGNGSTSGATINATCTTGSLNTILGNITFSKSGYTFTGWNTQANGSGASYKAGDLEICGAINILYAQWVPITTYYTVSYNGNGNTGGTAPVDSNSYLPGAAVTVMGNTGALAKTGYIFVGWNTAANGSGAVYTPGSVFTMGAASITTLYAQWSIIVIDTCGSSNGSNFTSIPSINLCVNGTPSVVTGNGPWNWTCTGPGGDGTITVFCSAGVIGTCGSSSGSPATSAPTTDLCSSGAPSTVTGIGPWTWTCAGTNGGATAPCSADIKIIGACGSSSGAPVTSAPSANLCSSGAPSAVTGIGPWNWTCAGTNGGATAPCSADILTYVVIVQNSGNGTVTCTPSVNYNSAATCTIIPSNGYDVVTPIGGTCLQGGYNPSQSANNYTTGSVTFPCTVAPIFVVSPVNVTINQVVLDNCPTVKSDVTVTKEVDGTPIIGLTSASFTVTEDGTARTPVTVNTIDMPLSIAMVLDYSGSMQGAPRLNLEAAAKLFIDELGASDELELIKFSLYVEVMQDFTTDKSLLATALSKSLSQNTINTTSLYNAIYKALSDTMTRSGRKAVVAMTDGQNDNYEHTLANVKDYAISLGIPVYTVGLGNAVDAAVLNDLATTTGGHYYNAPTAADLAGIYTTIAKLFRNQYQVSYPSNLTDGAQHILQVTANTAQGSGRARQPFTACSTAPHSGLPGDVNDDQVVNVFDALLTLQYAVGLYQPPDVNAFKPIADVAPLGVDGKPIGDGQVNVFDALAILRHAVGLDSW